MRGVVKSDVETMVEEIIRGESKNVEFKEMLPKNSEKYAKTIVAFANSQGGKIFFGIVDETREIVGIDESILFQTMDRIANTISDSVEPQIVPEIEPCTVEGKNIIVVTVPPEPKRPYYLKSKGMEQGTYIRVAGTTRLASLDKIKELEMEGAKISWDELICVGYEVKETAIKKLCRDMNRYRKDMQERKVLTKALPAVTRTNLEDWKIIKKTNEGYLASNAFVLLTSDYYQFSKTQCAVFKGNDRVVFLDKREFKGPLYSQIEDSIDFVLRNIRLGAKIEGLIRKEDYELPIEAIREMIVNAHCHRNMTDESCVQVAVFDDRLEVTSPGGFYNGLTFEEAMQGHSKLRNRAIANVFSQIGLIEAWGTGFKRIRNAAKEYGLPDPEFIEMPEMFRVNLYRKPMTSVGNASAKVVNDVGNNVGNVGNNVGNVGNDVGNVGNDVGNVGEQFSEKSVEDSDLKASIMNLISADSKVLSSEIAKQLSVSQRTVERHIKQLREDGQIIRHGSRTRGGYWEVTTTIHTTLK